MLNEMWNPGIVAHFGATWQHLPRWPGPRGPWCNSHHGIHMTRWKLAGSNAINSLLFRPCGSSGKCHSHGEKNRPVLVEAWLPPPHFWRLGMSLKQHPAQILSRAHQCSLHRLCPSNLKGQLPNHHPPAAPLDPARMNNKSIVYNLTYLNKNLVRYNYNYTICSTTWKMHLRWWSIKILINDDSSMWQIHKNKNTEYSAWQCQYVKAKSKSEW